MYKIAPKQEKKPKIWTFQLLRFLFKKILNNWVFQSNFPAVLNGLLLLNSDPA